MNGKPRTSGSVLIIGGGIGGMEAALNLAEGGFKVYLADRKPNIGGNMAQFDKIFPTNDCSMCVMAPKLVEVGRNPNIELLMNTEVVDLHGSAGNFEVVVRTRPRRVLPDKCTSCGLCASACPVEAGDVYNEGLSLRSAAFINFPQAIPPTYMIDRQMPSCIFACPIHLNARDYVGLIAEGSFLEAARLIREKLPFPGVIGRICAHPCETECLRGREVDEPVAICALKRFVADYEWAAEGPPAAPVGEEKEKRVAVIGGGPAGVTCAYELRRAGYPVTIFDSHHRLGGMLHAGIPRYRLPKDVLEREFSIVERMGAEIRYNTTVGRDVPLKDLLEGFDAVFIGSGAHGRRRLGLENEDASGVLNALDFLHSVNRGDDVAVGARAVVLGGGNVAMDVALTARRLGASEVHVVALERWEEMPAQRRELQQALVEGIRIHNAWGPRRILARDGRASAIELQRCLRVFNPEGDFDPLFDDSSTRVLPLDTLILVIYETIDTAYLAATGEVALHADGRVVVDQLTLETSIPGVFAGGNVTTGPRTAIHAVAHGKRAAESIIRFLEGRDLREGRLAAEDKVLDEPPLLPELRPRAVPPRLSLADRHGFAEINLSYTEEQAREEAKRCLNCRRCTGCGLCEEACKPGAIQYIQRPEERRLSVGSIIIAAGYDEYDAKRAKQFGYGRYPNVVTSVEYERILSATGPTGSLVMRPGDGKIPRKVAFIQCVGSRDRENEYCSAVCCMYATEEAVISREHHRDIEPTIFYNDIRPFGKGHDIHVERAKTVYGVRYVKSLVSRVVEVPSTGDLEIAYVDDEGHLRSELFDLVVLSVGLRPPKQLAGACKVLGVARNSYGFVGTEPLNPFAASVPGIYVCGASQSPKDITETVIDGAGAAFDASQGLKHARWQDTEAHLLPEERDVTGEEPRIGVFICNCGVNIGGVVDVPKVRKYAEGLPNVVLAEENLFTCAQDTQSKIRQVIAEHGLNRVVVASCSTRTHEPLFMSLVREAGLNRYLFEMANIRDQCSWVHMDDRPAATEKAKVLVRMAVAKANHMEPLKESPVAVVRRALVVGGGIAGMRAALGLAGEGFAVILVEREDALGGNLRNIGSTLDGVDVPQVLEGTIARVCAEPLISLHLDTEVRAFSGSKGDFETRLVRRTDGSEETVRHGTVILATGAREYKPEGRFLYGEDSRVMTQLELEGRLGEDSVRGARSVAMIQCVASRDAERPYCSRVCCAAAIKNAITLVRQRKDREVVIFFRDMMTYGFLERYYLEARRLGVRFVRYDRERPPLVQRLAGRLRVACYDPALVKELRAEADLLVLSSALVPNENRDLARVMRLPMGPEGFFLEAHVKLKPVDFATEGIYMAGTCHGPRNIGETTAQASGAVARTITILAKDELSAGGVVARVDPERCAACLTCVRSCPYGVPVIGKEGKAEIDAVKCKGCGTCAGGCPSRAIDLMNYSDAQITAKTRAACA